MYFINNCSLLVWFVNGQKGISDVKYTVLVIKCEANNATAAHLIWLL